MRPRRRVRIRQVDVDFLCLSVFGQRSLPDDMAGRIAELRDFRYRGLTDAFGRHPDTGPPEPEALAAVVA